MAIFRNALLSTGEMSVSDCEHLMAGIKLAVGETVSLLQPPLPLVGVSMVMERERQQNGRSLVNGQESWC